MSERLRVRALPSPASAASLADTATPSPGPPAGGQSLDARTQHAMSARFGHDFSQVRVHTDARAEDSAQAFGANAFTVGGDIVFGVGKYAPGTAAGERLLAHELTHVVQQARCFGSSPGDPARLSQRSDASEREAEALAPRAVNGEAVNVTSAPGAALARDESGQNDPWAGNAKAVDLSWWPGLSDGGGEESQSRNSAAGNSLWDFISGHALRAATLLGQMGSQSGGGSPPTSPTPPRAITDNMYEISADALEDVRVGGRSNPANIMHHDNLNLRGVADVTSADHAAVMEARARIAVGATGVPEVGGLPPSKARSGGMIPFGEGTTTLVPLETRPTSPNFDQPLDTQLRTHAENPALHNPTNANYNPNAYSANNPTTQINTNAPAAAGPTRYFDPATNSFGQPTAEAHMPAGGRDRGPTALGETPDSPALTGEPGPGRAAPPPGEYALSSEMRAGGPIHEVYGRSGDTLPAGMADDLDNILDPVRYGAPKGGPGGGGPAPSGGGSLWGTAGKVFNAANWVLNPLGIYSSAVGLGDNLRHGNYLDATMDAAGLTSSVIGTASMTGLIEAGSVLNPIGGVAGAGAGGYALGKYAVGKSDAYAKEQGLFGQDDGGENRTGSQWAADNGRAVDSFVDDRYIPTPLGDIDIPDVVGDIAGGVAAVGSSWAGAAYSGLHAAFSGPSPWEMMAQYQQLEASRARSAAITKEITDQLNAEDMEQMMAGPTRSVAYEEMPPLPPKH